MGMIKAQASENVLLHKDLEGHEPETLERQLTAAVRRVDSLRRSPEQE